MPSRTGIACCQSVKRRSPSKDATSLPSNHAVIGPFEPRTIIASTLRRASMAVSSTPWQSPVQSSRSSTWTGPVKAASRKGRHPTLSRSPSTRAAGSNVGAGSPPSAPDPRSGPSTAPVASTPASRTALRASAGWSGWMRPATVPKASPCIQGSRLAGLARLPGPAKARARGRARATPPATEGASRCTSARYQWLMRPRAFASSLSWWSSRSLSVSAWATVGTRVATVATKARAREAGARPLGALGRPNGRWLKPGCRGPGSRRRARPPRRRSPSARPRPRCG